MQSNEYRKNPRMNQSTLKLILDGFDVFKDYLDHPQEEPTDAQKIGLAVHTLILEPHKQNTVVWIPKVDGKTREGKILDFLKKGKSKQPDFFRRTKKKPKQLKGVFYEVTDEEYDFLMEMMTNYKEIFETPENFLILDHEDYQAAHAMTESVLKNSDSKYLLNACSDFEKIHEFHYNDIDWKAQLDGEGYDFILDLKTTVVANKDYLVRREMLNRRHPFQAATYRKPRPTRKYFTIFVRNVRPYTVFPVQMSDELLDEGDRQLDEACMLYKYCLENNPEFKADNSLRII